MNISRKLTLTAVALVFALTAFLSPASTPALAATCTINHTVASGDTLSSIAAKYNVSYQTIATANNLKEPYTIAVGQVLCIPGATTTTSTTGTTTTSGKKLGLVHDGKFLTITASGYPKKAIYYVKAGSGIPRTAKLVKIGNLHLRKDTSVTKRFRLPSSLENAKVLTVCLKNAKNDDQSCETVH
jgi:murein DD-endopeptidase MepM/ murein hydrolase activator NlpD